MYKALFVIFFLIVSGLAFSAETLSLNEIPYKAEAQDVSNIFYKIMFSLIFISALAYAIAVIIKKYFYGQSKFGASESKLGILEMKRISPRLTLLRVEANGEEVCLAQTDKDIVIINKVRLESHNEK